MESLRKVIKRAIAGAFAGLVGGILGRCIARTGIHPILGDVMELAIVILLCLILMRLKVPLTIGKGK